MIHRRTRLAAAATLSLLPLNTVMAQEDIITVKERIGWFDLEDRIGTDQVPTGQGIGVLQCEAPEGANRWIPDVDDAVRYAGKNFFYSGAPLVSTHANTVALEFYSNNGSVAPGIGDVWLYDANSFLLTGYLNLGQPSSVPPISPPGESLRIHNHSWIGQFGNSNDNLVLRRMDYVAIRDNILVVNGTNNGGPASHMFAHGFNTLTVGCDTGSHTATDVPSGIDGPGRMKPWLVAPGNLTSYTTPIVSAVGAMLYELIETDPVLADDFAAWRVQVMRSILLCGASRDEFWTNNPEVDGSLRGSTARPLDEVYGAGMVNVDRSHAIFTGYRSTGASTPASAPQVGLTGWDWPRVLQNNAKYWRFTVDTPLDELSVAVTWQRVPSTTFTSYTLMDLDLEVVRIIDEQPVSLVGGLGEGIFESGNVSCDSPVDNVELLSISGLQPGDYAIRLGRGSDGVQTTYAGISWLMIEGEAVAIEGDLDGDGLVDGLDLSILLGAWGTDDPQADINGDGSVDGSDLATLLGNWS